MTQRTQPSHFRFPQETATGNSGSGFFSLVVGVVTGISFLSAVLAASSMIATTYSFADLQSRERTALKTEQILDEQLASASSLDTLRQFAATSGLVAVAQADATLQVTTPVAAR